MKYTKSRLIKKINRSLDNRGFISSIVDDKIQNISIIEAKDILNDAKEFIKLNNMCEVWLDESQDLSIFYYKAIVKVILN